MKVEITKEGGNTVIQLNSRLDSTAAGEFDKTLKKAVPLVENALVLDFKNVDFISSMGLRVLVSAYKNLGGKEVILKNANSSVKEVLHLTGLLPFFTLL